VLARPRFIPANDKRELACSPLFAGQAAQDFLNEHYT
jgi:hypothetical protein